MKHKELPNEAPYRKRRGHSRYFIYFILILIGLAAIVYGTYYLLSTVDWFNIEQIQITGNATVSDSLLLQATQNFMGKNLFSISNDEVVSKIKKYSRIKDVKLRRRLFHTLNIIVTERKSCLYVKSLEGDLFPIDEEGVVLEKYGSVYKENLPVVNLLINNAALHPGKTIKNASLDCILALHHQIMKESPEFISNISEYYTINNTVYIIDARNGLRLIPSNKNLARQLSRYEFVKDNGNVSNNAILDLRFDNQVVVKSGN
ncbi:MAG: FtsQ-type POTRA domain-containing protein [Candidatus Cloacimonadaceae bacterium]|jgi:cell division septal protein FtsQ|nr:FtsQ-type POTRA domain-containing protein [Candidatus Cloacimonadota bacterium]MDY0112342.1 FtsQ-type POTRA domain-containing protein [Candidatus Syntrophosphaera sp.]